MTLQRGRLISYIFPAERCRSNTEIRWPTHSEMHFAFGDKSVRKQVRKPFTILSKGWTILTFIEKF